VSLFITALLSFQLDPAVAEAMTRALGDLQSFRVSFEQTTYSDFFDDTRAAGTISIDRPGRMRMVYSEGEEIVRIWDGTTAYEHDRAAANETRVPQEELSDEPIVRLLLYGSELTSLFLVDRIKRDGADVFRFRPRDNDQGYFIEVRFDEQWLPRELEVIGEDGEGSRFRFIDYDLSPTFSPDTFAVPPAP